MSRVTSITGVLAAVLAAAPGMLAQDPGVAAARADTAFIRHAIRGNFTEVALGRLAESRADDDAVEEFAERMISEHNAMNEDWAELAEDNEMRVGLDFGPDGAQAIDRLDDLDDEEFDQAYMAEMIRRHEQDLAVFQRMATSAGSLGVRELASSGESTIREHLALARQVGSRVGVSTTAGRAGGVTVPVPAPSDDRARRTTDRTTRDDRDDRDVRDDRDDRRGLRLEDRRFVQNVLQDHLMHIQLAERARREARTDETRRLAEHMEEEFEEWQQRWENVAERYGVRAPRHLGPLHGQKVEKLERASRGNIDRTYTSIVADHLESVVPYFEKEGQAVQSAAVRRLVNDELPVIRQILTGVQRLHGRAGVRERGSDRE